MDFIVIGIKLKINLLKCGQMWSTYRNDKIHSIHGYKLCLALYLLRNIDMKGSKEASAVFLDSLLQIY